MLSRGGDEHANRSTGALLAATMDWKTNSRMTPHLVPLDENEIKMLLVAIRQVQHTFAIAEAQSAQAGEPLANDFEDVQEAYVRLHEKLSALVVGPRASRA